MFKLQAVLFDTFGHAFNDRFANLSTQFFIRVYDSELVRDGRSQITQTAGLATIDWILHGSPQEEIHWC